MYGYEIIPVIRWGWGWNKSLIPVEFGYGNGDGDENKLFLWEWNNEIQSHSSLFPSLMLCSFEVERKCEDELCSNVDVRLKIIKSKEMQRLAVFIGFSISRDTWSFELIHWLNTNLPLYLSSFEQWYCLRFMKKTH